MSAAAATKRKPGPEKGFGFWTPERIASAAVMWGRGDNTFDIARHFGSGRSSAASMMARNRHRFPKRADLPALAGMKHPVKKALPKAEPVAETVRTSAPVPPPRRDAWNPLPASTPVGLMRVCGCRWPVECEDDRFIRASTYFRDAPRHMKPDRFGKLKQSSYCATHDAMSVGVGTQSERSAVHELARAG